MTSFLPRRLYRMSFFRNLRDQLDRAQAQRDEALSQRDDAFAERDDAFAERDAAFAERDAAFAERDAAFADRDAALADRDATQRSEQAMGVERDAADRAARETRQERDSAIAARDAMGLELSGLAHPLAPVQSVEEIRDHFRTSVEFLPAAVPKAIIVPVRGAIAAREVEVTKPFFESYCQHIGADLRIVDVPESIDGLLVKASLAPVAREYRRFAIMDPDVIIRGGCPDLFSLVPEDELGAVVEGRWSDRVQICAELADLYGIGVPLPSERYIATGVMVMSGAHLTLLEALMRGPTVPHPKGEQGFINAGLHRNDTPIHGLPRDFNWSPYSDAEFDWRYATIFHMGDGWRAPPRQDFAWRINRYGEGRCYARERLSPGHVRLPCLIEIAEQLRGENVHIFHPGDMGYHPPIGRILLTPEDIPVMWCEPGASPVRDAPPIYGPYANLEAGHWSVTLLAADGKSPADSNIVVDLVHDVGSETIRWPAPIGSSATFDILLEHDVADVEVRIYRGTRDFAIGSIVFRRLRDQG